MKFEKMENGSLRCTLTQEDLEQNGVELEDFFSNTANAREFLEKLIRIAEDEVGYTTNGNMMSIQAAIMSEDEIVLTFSDSQVSGSQIDVKEDILSEAGGKSKDTQSEAKCDGYVYLLTFASFPSVRNFCRILPQNHLTDSRLYYLNQKKQYFLWADLDNSTKGYVYEFVAASMEYANGIEKDSARSSYLEEHADVIIKEHALEKLAQL